MGRFFANANMYLHNPHLIAERIFDLKPKAPRNCIEDDDVLQKPAGWLVAVNFAVFTAVLLFVFIYIHR